MRRMLAMLVITAALAPAIVSAEAPDDYAYRAPITIQSGTPFQRIALPSFVYGVLTHADMRDMRVFNGAGEVVPHGLEPRPATRLDDAAAVAVPLFALPRTETGSGALAVQVERRTDGTVVSVRESAGSGTASPHAWLLDASQLKRSVRALALTPADAQAQFAGRMRVEASDDLEHWRILAPAAPLLVARAGDQALTRLRIEWPAGEARYLRLSWADATAHAVDFSAVRLEPAQVAREPARVWERVEPQRMRGGEGEYTYSLPAGAPIDRLRIHLPQRNAVVPVSLLARDGRDREWRSIGRHTVYRLEKDGVEFENPDIAAQPSGDLMLRFDTRAGGPGNGMPTVEIGWVPHTLVFAARGSGPFLIAYGDADAKAAAYPIDSLVPGYGDRDNQAALALIGPASLGEARIAGGEARLRPALDFKRWLLWGVLLLAVLALAAMAHRLWRQMGTDGSPPGA